MNATVTEKWTAVFADETLAKKVLAMSAEDAQKELAANGYEFTLEEMHEAGEEINKAVQSTENGELTEDNLENVAGGFSSYWVRAACEFAAGFYAGQRSRW